MAKETKDVVEFLFALGEATGKSLEDEDVGLGDAVFLFDAFRKVGAAVDGITKVPGEIATWTHADTLELEKLATEFDIPQDNIEALVEDATKLAAPFIEFIAKHFLRKSA